jgi:hypothetical protein
MAAHIAAVTCAVLAALVAPSGFTAVAAAGAGQGAAGSARPASSPPTRPDESLIVNVPATAPWTDTGVVVRAGDRIDMRAWGRVVYRAVDEARFITPTGSGAAGGCNYVLVDSGVPANAVVANIAPDLTFDGKGFLVGSARTVTVPAAGSSAPEGRLFVGINHQGIVCDRSGYDSWEFRNNSSGAFTVEIAIRRKK